MLSNSITISSVFVLALTVSEILTFQIFLTSKKQGKVTEYNFRNDAMENIKICKNRGIHSSFFALALTVSEILTFHIFILRNRSRSKVQFSQCYSSMTMSAKIVPCIFALAQTISDILTIQVFNLQNVSRSRLRCTIFAVTAFDGKYKNLQS